LLLIFKPYRTTFAKPSKQLTGGGAFRKITGNTTAEAEDVPGFFRRGISSKKEASTSLRFRGKLLMR
jgi:hypothetical protein